MNKKNKNLIKKFLVASAAISGLATISGSASAANRTTIASLAKTSDGVGFNKNQGGQSFAINDGDTLIFSKPDHIILVNSNLSGPAGITFQLVLNNQSNTNLVGIGDNGALRIKDILNYSEGRVLAGNALNIEFGPSNNLIELILDRDFNNGQLGIIDFKDNANSRVIIDNNVKIDVLNIISSSNNDNGSLVAKGNFEIKTRGFGHSGENDLTINSFNLFTDVANSTGKIIFDTAKVDTDINAYNPIVFSNNGNLILQSTGVTNVIFDAPLNIADKTTTITFNGGGANFGFDMKDSIRNAKNASFVVDMAHPDSFIDLSDVTAANFLGADGKTAKNLTIKKGRIVVSGNVKFTSVTFDGSEKPTDGTLALCGRVNNPVHTIILDPKSPKNTGILQILEDGRLHKDSTVFTKNSPGIFELYFENTSLILTKESNNIDAKFITSRNDVTGVLSLTGSATLGSKEGESYIGYYPNANGQIIINSLNKNAN